MSHTPEPWSFEVTDEHDEYSCDVFDSNELSIIDGSNGLITEANARRIVACVNACAGIPTGVLAIVGAFGGFGRDNMVQHATKQRDELLAAMIEAREALQFANDSPAGGISDTIWMMHRPETLFDFMDTAIARVKGGAA